MIQTIGKAYRHKGGVVIQTNMPPVEHLSPDVICLWSDERQISPEQRRKAWALIGEISSAYGYLSSEDRRQLNGDMKRKFLLERMDELTADAIRRFSLSDIDMTTARLYIDFLVQFVLEHEIPTKQPLWELAEDIERYVYGCLMHKRCAVCGRPAELHHVDRIGMGRNRDEVYQIGMRVLPLCRTHHMEDHQHGKVLEKYHLAAVTLDEKIGKVYGLSKKNMIKGGSTT